MKKFDTMCCRKDKGSLKWTRFQEQCPRLDSDIIPFTLADNDYPHPPQLVEGLQNYINDMVFGYTIPTDDYYDAIISWFERRHQWDIQRSWILQSPGVLPAIANAVDAFSKPDDAVVIMTPVYYPFSRLIHNRGRRVEPFELTYKEGKYSIDFDALENHFKHVTPRLLILCSPHNPVGRVWTRTELEQLVLLCDRYDVLILADEIHHDVIMPGYIHTCINTVNDLALNRAILFTSTSKSFNLAGLKASAVIIPDESLRHAYVECAAQQEAGILSINAFGIKATEIALNACEPWLDEFIVHIQSNHDFVKAWCDQNCPRIHVCPLEGTYLQWLDFNAFNLDDHELFEIVEEQCHVYCDRGKIFGNNGSGFMRMNLAYPQEVIEHALNRLLQGFK